MDNTSAPTIDPGVLRSLAAVMQRSHMLDDSPFGAAPGPVMQRNHMLDVDTDEAPFDGAPGLEPPPTSPASGRAYCGLNSCRPR